MSEGGAPRLDPEIAAHYAAVDEAGRLDRPGSQIERVRTRELMSRYLPPPPAVVLDIGGGAGVHAFWLAARGYAVHLVDPVPRHIQQARARAAEGDGEAPASMTLGDARHLEFADRSADAVLLFGPLYHLVDAAERRRALDEAWRVLRSGGRLMAVGISRFISTLNCLTEGLIGDEQFVPIVEQDLRDGQHRNPTGEPHFFTTAFFHHPDELAAEVEGAGFVLDALLSVEGPAQLTADLARHWNVPERRAWLLKIVRHLEAEPHLLGVGPHIMAIGRRESGPSAPA